MNELTIFEAWNEIKSTRTPKSLEVLAEKLGVEPLTLQALGCQWSHRHWAWAFPLIGTDGEVIGIRLMNECGEKFYVKDSKRGSFFSMGPLDSEKQKIIKLLHIE
jgi:hypothetical protein